MCVCVRALTLKNKKELYGYTNVSRLASLRNVIKKETRDLTRRCLLNINVKRLHR